VVVLLDLHVTTRKAAQAGTRHVAPNVSAEYREMFTLKNDYPMTTPSYVARRAEFAIRIGLGGPEKKTLRQSG
jgi:predicted transcriptional regulator